MINKYIFYSLFFIFSQQNIYAQYQKLLINTFINDVQYDTQNNILCAGSFWISSYPQVTQKLNQNLEYLWPNNEYGVLLTNPTGGDFSRAALILPQDDGSVIFTMEYKKYGGLFDCGDSLIPCIEEIYYAYPVIQKVSADGEVLWGENGIRLSSYNVICDISAPILLLNTSYDTEGNVVVFWTYTFAENEDKTEEFKGTFMQKINPVSGELLYDSTGIKLLDENVSSAIEGKNSNVYFIKLIGSLQAGPEIINIDKNGTNIWSFDLIEKLGDNYQSGLIANITSNGDLFILYSSNPTFGAYIYSDGKVKFKNKIILPGSVRITRWTPFMEWEQDKWILFSEEYLYYFSSDGEQFWDTTGVHIHSPISGIVFEDMAPMNNNNSILILYSIKMDSSSSYRVLKMQKISNDGSLVWQREGIDLVEGVSSGLILPVNDGGAFIVADAHAFYQPKFRPRGSYILRIDANGNVITKLPIVTDQSSLSPKNFLLVNNFPNPFSECTHFIIHNNSFLNDKPTNLIIYNILGKEVQRYDIKIKNLSNRIELSWDGKDQFGRQVSPGMYLYKLITNDYSTKATGKLILIK